MFVHGEFLDHTFRIDPEPMSVIAQIAVDRDTLEFRDVAIYCGKGDVQVPLGTEGAFQAAPRGHQLGTRKRIQLCSNHRLPLHRRQSTACVLNAEETHMIHVGPLQVNAALAARTAEILQASSVESTIAFLRLEGEDKIGTIRLLVKVADLPLGEAKRLVHCSLTWADRRRDDDSLHDSLADAAELMDAETVLRKAS